EPAHDPSQQRGIQPGLCPEATDFQFAGLFWAAAHPGRPLGGAPPDHCGAGTHPPLCTVLVPHPAYRENGLVGIYYRHPVPAPGAPCDQCGVYRQEPRTDFLRMGPDVRDLPGGTGPCAPAVRGTQTRTYLESADHQFPALLEVVPGCLADPFSMGQD